MVAAAVLLAGCGEPVRGSDGGSVDRDAGAVVVCDDGIARCPAFYVPVCGAGTTWQWDPVAMSCDTRYGITNYPEPRRVEDCGAAEPCPDGLHMWCLPPLMRDDGVVCQGNADGE